MRVVTFITLIFLAVLLPLPAVVLLFGVYILKWQGLEILFLAASLDAYFGSSFVYPVYLICSGTMLISLLWLKPYLSVYNGS